MRERKISHRILFRTKELAERFQQLYYDYMPLYNNEADSLRPFGLGGVYRSISDSYPWECIFNCTSPQWNDLKGKLRLQYIAVRNVKGSTWSEKGWVFKEKIK